MMKLLTQKQAKEVWLCRKEFKKVMYLGKFNCYQMNSWFEGCKYHVNSLNITDKDGNQVLDENSTKKDLENAFIGYLRTVQYKS